METCRNQETSLLGIETSIILLSFLVSIENISTTKMMEAVETNGETGEAFVTSGSSTWQTPFDAFRSGRSLDDIYWSSQKNPSTPVLIWFRFHEATRINKIAFEEKNMTQDDIFEVNVSLNSA